MAHICSEGRTCYVCEGNYYIFTCQRFQKKKTLQQIIKQIKSLKLCLNCLRPGHQVNKCNSANCKQCSKHNTLLYLTQVSNSEDSAKPSIKTSTPEQVVAHSAQLQSQTVLLSTARIQVKDSRGKYQNHLPQYLELKWTQ